MALPNYDSDERVVDINNKEQSALTEHEKTYSAAKETLKNTYDDATADLEKSRAEQERIANEKTDFAIEKIEQNQEQARKDYIKEQSGAYVDWQKESNKYGANAERMASYGMGGSGYSESSMVRYYTAYQNRIAVAREANERANLEFSNQIKDAELQNSSLLAEIALSTLQKKLELNVQYGLQAVQLLTEEANKRLDIQNMFNTQRMNMYSQINSEEALRLQQKQLQLDQEKFNYQKKQDEAAAIAEANTNARKTAYVKSGGGNSSTRNSSSSTFEKNKGGVNKNKSGFTGKTYDEAVAYMEKNGVAGSYASNVMTRSEFSRAKASGGTRGNAQSYATYADYLNDYVKHAING